MNTPLRSTAREPKPAVDGAPIRSPGRAAPTAPVGQREYEPSACTKRPPATTFALPSIAAVALATTLPPVGPTDSDSSLCRRPCWSSEHVSLLKRPGVPLAKPHAGIR